MPKRMTKNNKKIRRQKTTKQNRKLVKITQKFKGGMLSRMRKLIYPTSRNSLPINSPENIQSEKEESLRRRQMHVEGEELKLTESIKSLEDKRRELQEKHDEFKKLETQEMKTNPLYQNEMVKQSIDELKKKVKEIKDITYTSRREYRIRLLGHPEGVEQILDSDFEHRKIKITLEMSKLLEEIEKIMNPHSLSNNSKLPSDPGISIQEDRSNNNPTVINGLASRM
jgi:hypothetical protein